MSEWFTSFGVSLGGFAALIASITWSAKTLIAHFLTRDVEHLKSGLQFSFENHKNELGKELENHKIILTQEKDKNIHKLITSLDEKKNKNLSLHQKIMDITPALYSKIQKSYFLVKSQIQDHKNFNSSNVHEEIVNEIDDAYEFFMNHRIYFEERFCSELENFKEVFEYPLLVKMALVGDLDTLELPEQQIEISNYIAATESFHERAQKILSYIELDFRKKIGVEE